jgi:hypothetical protein
MPQWTLNYLTDGQQPLASGLTTLFTDAKAAIDAPTAKEIRRGAFNRHHGGHLVGAAGSLTETFQKVAGHGLHSYPLSVFGAYLGYANATDYGVNGGTFSGGAAGTTTWVSIGHPSATGPYVGAGGPEFLITYGLPFRLDGTVVEGLSFGIRAVELGLNIEVHEITPGDGSTATNVMFCIQYRTVESATWITIDRTIRSVSVDDRVRVGDAVTADPDFDVSIRSLFTQDDLFDGDRLHSFRAMCALEAGAGGLVADDTLTLRFGNFSAVPIRCEVDNQ